MALTRDFSVAQLIGVPAVVYLTDTSTGSDAEVKSRVVYLQKTDGTYLTVSDQETSVTIAAETAAICYIGGLTLRSTGDEIVTQVADPVLGTITIATYTQVSGDTTLAILVTNVIAAINDDVNGYGYTAENYDATTFNIIAREGLGDSIDDAAGTISYPGGSTSNTFSGGVDAIVLPLAGEDYNYWPYADSTISLSVLDKDYALTVTVNWLGATNNVLYTQTILTYFSMYNDEFDYSLTSLEASDPMYIASTNWYNYRIKYRVEIDNAEQAISLASSIGNAQASLDRATYIMENQSLYF
jgi:hypothetical protein